MKILITGGAGFIGSNLAEALLAKGHSVRILDNFCSGHLENLKDLHGDLEIMEGDVTSPSDCEKACSGMDVVSHQAALGSVPRSLREPELYSFNNLHGFVTLCNQARIAGISRIVYASSSSVYGDLIVSPKDESMRGRPLSPYAASKQGNEDFAQAFAYAYGMTFVGFRYFNVFGPKQDPGGPYAAVIPLFISKLIRGESPTIFGDGQQSRDFTYVGNVVQANILGLFAELRPDAYLVNVACGESATVNELYEGIAAELGSTILPNRAPERLGDIRDSMADISMAQSLLGYKDFIRLNQGLVSTVNWYRQHPDRMA